MEYLSPCPFCGKMDSLIEANSSENSCDCQPELMPYYTYFCDVRKGGCGATCGYQDTPELAVAAWNRRADVGCK